MSGAEDAGGANHDDANEPGDHDSGEEPRKLTIDDVERLGSGGGVAVGCAIFVVVAIALFWMVRGLLMR